MTNGAEIAREARHVLDDQVRRLRRLPYGELTRYPQSHAFEVTVQSGTVFQMEVTAF